MAQRKFLLRGSFAEGAAERRDPEEGIVTEAPIAAFFLQRYALDRACVHANQTRPLHQYDPADESCRAILYAAHPLQQQTIIGFVGSARSRISRRVDSRCSA